MPLASLKPGAAYPAAAAVEVCSLFAHLYREPDVTRHQPLLTVPFETRLEMAGEPGERWLKVRLVDGGSAWVQTGDVLLHPEPLSVEASIALARRFVGQPYTWGGTSSFGYDCSGFTQMLYRRRGIRIPRDAGPQARWTGFVPVAKSSLQPGDLLYFGPSVEKIDHTGMYIGQGEFAHWAALLVACRRPR